ncbi:MAG: glycoside hydrolase family 31 protein [Clostridiales bacterium]|jgi:alpha-glucosidase (family GH31 glycosyl hydrolase)|nr:glycoside hydrolase family 31 protein [Clostridiales bacterium]
MELKEIYKPKIDAAPNADGIISEGGFRLTVISDGLFRVEIDDGCEFLNLPSQSVWRRDFGKTAFKAERLGAKIRIETDRAVLIFDKRLNTFKILLKAEKNSASGMFLNCGNLKGTRRTLDGAVGAVKLGRGVMSKKGIAAFDDKKSLVLREDGMLEKRGASRRMDLYIFAYGSDYSAALVNFYRLTGQNPLLPRFALGNWWSRYHEYTAEEYLSLMKTFRDNGIPFSVATVDMDWHVTDISKEYGSGWAGQTGWTGYTWNRELFKDPIAFLKELKDAGYKVTLNLHPADGCRAYEDYYGAIADYMGVDKEQKEPVRFDMTNPRFINAYFEFLHYPLEREGVDFWWIDWQQGKKTAVDNLDPLWLLNHYHTLDNAKNDLRPLILSRYAGIGSHRYQVGFSGDTYISWRMLNFMPYFTTVAANIGFTWWSHDIGGHHFGKKDGELYLRWLQSGVFGPIMRLHGTKNRFIDKSPMKYRADIAGYAVKFLRLRHKLIPYIYTMNYLSHAKGEPLCKPMYYAYGNPEFYKKKYRNIYMFGTELLAAPITKPADKASKTGLSYAEAFLPEGAWTDIFTGRVYTAGKEGAAVRMYRDLESIPVLAKEGAILITDEKAETDTSNPSDLRVTLFPGRDNDFTLYEDDGESMRYKDGACVTTEFSLRGGRKDFTLKIKAPEGDVSLIPSGRKYAVAVRNALSADVSARVLKARHEIFAHVMKIESGTAANITKTGNETTADTLKSLNGISAHAVKAGCGLFAETYKKDSALVIEIAGADAFSDIEIVFSNVVYRADDKDAYVFSVWDRVETDVTKKNIFYKLYKRKGITLQRGLKKIIKEKDFFN